MFRFCLSFALVMLSGCGDNASFSGAVPLRLPSQDAIFTERLQCQLEVSRDEVTLGESVEVMLTTSNLTANSVSVNGIESKPDKVIQFTPTQMGEFKLLGIISNENSIAECKSAVSVDEPKVIPVVIQPSCSIIGNRQSGAQNQCDLVISSTGGTIDDEPVVNAGVSLVLSENKWRGTTQCGEQEQTFEVQVRNAAGQARCSASIPAVNITRTYNLTTSVTGSGSIGKNPNGNTFNQGTVVILTATPGAGHSFAGWGGACSGASPTCSVTMNGNKSVVANFTINTHTLATSVTGSGSISKNPNATRFNYGTEVILTATPGAGHSFAGWGGACSGASPTCSVTMNGNKEVTAIFANDPPVCTNLHTERVSKDNHDLKVWVTKDAAGGAVQDVLINGEPMVGSWSGDTWYGIHPKSKNGGFANQLNVVLRGSDGSSSLCPCFMMGSAGRGNVVWFNKALWHSEVISNGINLPSDAHDISAEVIGIHADNSHPSAWINDILVYGHVDINQKLASKELTNVGGPTVGKKVTIIYPPPSMFPITSLKAGANKVKIKTYSYDGGWGGFVSFQVRYKANQCNASFVLK